VGFAVAGGGLVAVVAGGLLVVLSAVGRGPLARSRSAPRWRLAAGALGALVAGTAGLVLWVGAHDPHVTWFGPVDVHGPRRGDQVALTFDDGPDPRWSERVAAVLDERGVDGTFFLVGAAIDRWPEVARRLDDQGHLLGNHAYHHDSWRWLDPRYPELDRTQRTFARRLDRCPALFRPPHGQRTPFVLSRADAAGLRTVTWDVSAEDWSDSDGERVARRILAGVRPGSIVLLHDGLDGRGDAEVDRSVLLEALPLILDGLEARGLTPVRLDELLGTDGYLPPDRC